MTRQTRCRIFAILILSLYITESESAKLSARPVHESSNEQARIDEKRSLNLGTLPYGNPLAGNSKQNARIHAQNQQAMFNAERIRQHRAQLQRWTKAPPKMDSYMKAYQESQENHHLALEQQQSRGKERLVSTSTAQTLKQDPVKPSNLLNAEPLKITKADAIIRPEVNRSHRSFGSLEYQYLQPKQLQNVYLAAGPTYGQGVTIKPNANIGFANLKTTPETKLFSKAIPSTANYAYSPHNFESYASSVKDINTLNSLLLKSPHEQFTNFNSLLEPLNSQSESNTPIDLQFYINDFPQEKEQVKYVDLPLTYATVYMPKKQQTKDFVPITEEVDDIANPNDVRAKPIKANKAQTQATDVETTTTKSYYKIEVASQTIKSGYKNPQGPKTLFKPENPQYHYAYNSPVSYLLEREKPEIDLSKKYQHLNIENKGVLHLNGDGTGVSAYGDDNLHYAANYEFGYRVQDHKTGNDFGHHEAKHGGKTNGQYHVLLPDGRMQNVKYSAGPEGFHADISYDHLQYQYT